MKGRTVLSSGWWLPLLLVLLLSPPFVMPQEAVTEGPMKGLAVVTFDPESIMKVQDGTEHHVTWFTNYTGRVDRVWAEMESTLEAKVTSFSDHIQGAPEGDNVTDLTGVTYYGYVNISALFVGYTFLNVTLYDDSNETVAAGMMEMTVVLSYQQVTDIFTYTIAVIIGVAYFFMGATIELEVVKGIAKKPVGPVVGLFCQYVLMPMISFALGLVMFPGDDLTDRLMRLGLFLGGCCPGGGSSNMWTILLGGSLDLSIMMTAVSTVFAFVSVPLWVLLLGPVIINDATFIIPFTDITITVVSLLIPCGLGVALQIFYPKSVKYCIKIVGPISGLSILITFTFGLYAYKYIFALFTWRMIVSGFFLPMIGYLAGMTLALIFRMPVDRIIAVSVETGVQNYTIAIIILQMTLVSPAGQLASAMPGASVIFTPLPLMVLLLAKKIYARVKGGSLNISTPSDLKEVSRSISTVALEEKEKNGKTAPNGGIDNPAADLKDTV